MFYITLTFVFEEKNDMEEQKSDVNEEKQVLKKDNNASIVSHVLPPDRPTDGLTDGPTDWLIDR